jgi:hypothetical protein
MEYKVVPFTGNVNQKETVDTVAKQLETLIQKYTDLGWEYIRLEGVSTYVQPEEGCFGGGKPGHMVSHQMVVFRRL